MNNEFFEFKCKQNDVIIKVLFVNNKIDAIYVSACPEVDGWTIIGYEDLQEALIKALETLETE